MYMHTSSYGVGAFRSVLETHGRCSRRYHWTSANAELDSEGTTLTAVAGSTAAAGDGSTHLALTSVNACCTEWSSARCRSAEAVIAAAAAWNARDEAVAPVQLQSTSSPASARTVRPW